MPSTFEQLTPELASKLVNTNIAFTGVFADNVRKEISEGNPEVYVAFLAPVKLHGKRLFFKRRTRLKFDFVSNGHRETKLIFGNRENFQSNKPCRLETLASEAIVLVVGPSPNSGASLSVNAGVSGEILNDTNLGKSKTVKQIFIWLFKVIDPADMVGWYDPGQLARTGVEVFFSTLFGRHSDFRLMEALTPVESGKLFHDFTGRYKSGTARDGTVDLSLRDELDLSGERVSELWLDYVGDVGDGWDSTYSIAYLLAQPELSLPDATAPGASRVTKRGDILVFGGDQVYPIADRANYAQRLLGPYETALDETSSPHPHAFAIPGNHDWYDSLVSFTRLFCQNRWFAGWQTDQSRSYFALKLPGGWWFLGTDVQLDSDIDVPQVKFFKEVAKNILPGDRVIVCTAEPHWVYAALYGKDDSNYNENNLAFFESRVIPNHARIVAFIAGDQHHYRRYQQETDHTQKITAGGGGAFLHPTHGEEALTLEGGFRQKTVYPPKSKSRNLGLLALLFLKYNFLFGVLTGALYVLTSWSVMVDISSYGAAEPWSALATAIHGAVKNPFAVFWILAAFGGFLLFTDTHSKVYRWIAGPLHGLAHLTLIFLIGWGATRLTVFYFGLEYQSFSQLLAAAAIIFFLGWILGSTLMGVYLYISLNWCGRHSNEAFSALAIKDWKNFLRIKIESNGRLTIFPIGIPKVPTKWNRREGERKRADGSRKPDYEPGNQPLSPVLIESPISFCPVDDGKGSVRIIPLEQDCPKVSPEWRQST